MSLFSFPPTHTYMGALAEGGRRGAFFGAVTVLCTYVHHAFTTNLLYGPTLYERVFGRDTGNIQLYVLSEDDPITTKIKGFVFNWMIAPGFHVTYGALLGYGAGAGAGIMHTLICRAYCMENTPPAVMNVQ